MRVLPSPPGNHTNAIETRALRKRPRTGPSDLKGLPAGGVPCSWSPAIDRNRKVGSLFGSIALAEWLKADGDYRTDLARKIDRVDAWLLLALENFSIILLHGVPARANRATRLLAQKEKNNTTVAVGPNKSKNEKMKSPCSLSYLT